MTDQFVILKTVIQSLGYTLKNTCLTGVVVGVHRANLNKALCMLSIRRMFKK